jgi:hypothetical protein
MDLIGNCLWCGKFGTMTREHLIPASMGGKNKDNLALACSRCNHERGKFTEIYFLRLQLDKSIYDFPERAEMYIDRFYKRIKALRSIINKWDKLHKKKNIELPFNIIELIDLESVKHEDNTILV